MAERGAPQYVSDGAEGAASGERVFFTPFSGKGVALILRTSRFKTNLRLLATRSMTTEGEGGMGLAEIRDESTLICLRTFQNRQVRPRLSIS